MGGNDKMGVIRDLLKIASVMAIIGASVAVLAVAMIIIWPKG